EGALGEGPAQGEDLLLQPRDMRRCLSGNSQQPLTKVGVIHPVGMLRELRHSAGFCAVGVAQILKQPLAVVRGEDCQETVPACEQCSGERHTLPLLFFLKGGEKRMAEKKAANIRLYSIFYNILYNAIIPRTSCPCCALCHHRTRRPRGWEPLLH